MLKEEIMSEKLYPVLAEAKRNTLIDNATYLEWYQESVSDPDSFWAKHGRRIDWFKPFTKVKNTDFNGDVSIKWYEDGAVAIRSPSSGKATIPISTRRSPIANCMKMSAVSPMC